MDRYLLFKQYRQILCPHELYPNTEAVIVLSGPPVRDSSGNVTSEYSLENIARIAFGVQTVLIIAAQKMGRSSQTISFGDGPYLVLNGYEQQLRPMEEIAENLEVPSDRIILVNSGQREVSNTKTQFEMIIANPTCKHFQNVAYITHDYHTLRVALTAKKYLPSNCSYVILSVPNGYMGFSYNKFHAFRKEIGKIQAYVDRGDIAKSL